MKKSNRSTASMKKLSVKIKNVNAQLDEICSLLARVEMEKKAKVKVKVKKPVAKKKKAKRKK